MTEDTISPVDVRDTYTLSTAVGSDQRQIYTQRLKRRYELLQSHFHKLHEKAAIMRMNMIVCK